MNIYVGNLQREATEEDLRKLFNAFGEVVSVTVIRDKFSGISRGFGFIEMPNRNSAQNAISELNGKEFMGRNLRVNEARPRREFRGRRNRRFEKRTR